MTISAGTLELKTEIYLNVAEVFRNTTSKMNNEKMSEKKVSFMPQNDKSEALKFTKHRRESQSLYLWYSGYSDPGLAPVSAPRETSWVGMDLS